jgi:hypothetical protein
VDFASDAHTRVTIKRCLCSIAYIVHSLLVLVSLSSIQKFARLALHSLSLEPHCRSQLLQPYRSTLEQAEEAKSIFRISSHYAPSLGTMPIVPGPFIRHLAAMVPTSHSPKWIAVEDETLRQTARPERTVRTSPQRRNAVSRGAPFLGRSDDKVSPRSSDCYNSHAGVYDISEIPDINVFARTLQSQKEKGTATGISALDQLSHAQSLASESSHVIGQRHSPVSATGSTISPHNWETSPSSNPVPATARTTFPRMSQTVSILIASRPKYEISLKDHGKPHRKAPYDPCVEVREAQGRNDSFWGRFREIYHAGPYGEGQKFWWHVGGICTERRNRKRRQFRRQQYNKISQTPIISDPIGSNPRPRPAANIDRKVNKTHQNSHARDTNRVEGAINSMITMTSLELPLAASPTVQHEAVTTARDRYVEVSRAPPLVLILKLPIDIDGRLSRYLKSHYQNHRQHHLCPRRTLFKNFMINLSKEGGP